jgi:23S rRNA G2445 N2-methylase RlmL
MRTTTFHLSCAAGFESVVGRALRSDLSALARLEEESGRLRLEAPPQVAAVLRDLPYLSVALEELAVTGYRGMDVALRSLAGALAGRSRPPAVRSARTFRLRVSDAGRLVRVEPRAREALERAVAHWGRLTPEPRGGDLELWVTHRRDSPGVDLSVRFDAPGVGRVPPGALRPEVAGALVRVEEPSPSERVLDPFAGSGAIPVARARYPFRAIVASDVDGAAAAALRRVHPRVRAARADIHDLRALRNLVDGGAVERIITDPPWGMYEGAPIDALDIHRALWAAGDELLAPGGSLTVLTGAPDDARAALTDSDLVETGALPVLVNGKKATVLTVRHPDG